MALSERENYLRNARFEGAEWIPIHVYLTPALWLELKGELEEIVLRHPVLFPDYRKGRRSFGREELDNRHRKGEKFRDAWGCLWDNAADGVVGQVLEHPLDDWAKFEGFEAPDPMTTDDHNEAPDWEARAKWMKDAKKAGKPAAGGIPHGWFFMRLYYLRGFENLMMDIGLEEPRLLELIEMVKEHNRVKVEKWVSLEPDVLHFPEDLGTQNASMISPAAFHRLVTPVYKELMGLAKAKGILVHMHSDGHITELADELHEAGVDILNPQDLCNGVDEIKRTMKGRFCIDLDIDRQKVVPFGKPKEIRELIEMEVRELGSKEGGLTMVVGVYPPAPPENVEALLSAFEEFRTFWWR